MSLCIVKWPAPECLHICVFGKRETISPYGMIRAFRRGSSLYFFTETAIIVDGMRHYRIIESTFYLYHLYSNTRLPLKNNRPFVEGQSAAPLVKYLPFYLIIPKSEQSKTKKLKLYSDSMKSIKPSFKKTAFKYEANIS